jgi:Zn-dependent M28 family amino/carboxypeptidase
MHIPFITSLFDLLNGNRLIIFNSRDIVRTLAVKIGDRSAARYENLQQTRQYVIDMFVSYGARPVEEKFTHDGKEFANIVVELPGRRKSRDEIIVVGAHYDTVEGSCGANDNASGVAALLESYRIMSRMKLKRTIRFVAFTLEEPPFFGTDRMGSMIHAEQCVKTKEKISLMVSLDMLGYASLFVKQEYPMEHMKDQYPATGDFLAVAALPSYSQYAFLFKRVFNKHSHDKIHDIVAPASVGGINLSDHMAFHKFGIPAIMVCDTGVYRNKNYHTEHDTEDTINYWFLAHNIRHICQALRDIANEDSIP